MFFPAIMRSGGEEKNEQTPSKPSQLDSMRGDFGAYHHNHIIIYLVSAVGSPPQKSLNTRWVSIIIYFPHLPGEGC